ncbi:helix-turn-helix domain-containing protein [Egibacter rhizosphaerae]|uniref:Helix-turn-helix domain-containing protein n=1 Tax=Egibacter rhizosphaerae TaxID=1670831 RepID=A0A411YB20_9ACTN|nr:XRE family transcriptional regulator [Egibacter rhizosphaerae]QBI18404.1 helix-turn-helix domain-containing protein [Egibacter rhizosphaerae]
MEQPTSGTALVDELIDGVRIGDNLVFQGEAGTPLALLVDRFVSAARGQLPLVIVNAAEPWKDEVPEGVTVLDWSPVHDGTPSPLARALDEDATFEDALASLRAVEADVGSGAAFVFDRLSAVQDAWGSDAALELFLSACPRLYRQRSLAVWPVDWDRHRPAFLRRLGEITQVVLELAATDGDLQVTVRKADGRKASIVGRSVRARVADRDLQATEAPTSTRERLGTVIRDQRLALGMPQAELARRVGITPSALSQIERGVRGPSGDTLMGLWEVLGVPFGPTTQPQDRGYRVARRSGRERVGMQDGLTGECLVDDPAAGELWLLELAPGVTGGRSPFAVKSIEVVTVVRGVLDLHLEGRTETLHEGDALVAAEAAVTGWANPSSTSTQVHWSLHPRP